MNASSIAIDGVAIEPGGRYRVAVNSYLADGGSGFSVLGFSVLGFSVLGFSVLGFSVLGFSVLEEGSERNGGGIDLDALAAHFAKAGAVAPGAQDRITRLN